MSVPFPPRPEDFYRSLPKVELHRHLEGSLRLSTIIDIAKKYELTLPGVDLRPKVQMGAEEAKTYENFLSKFKTLRLMFRSREIIERITYEAVADAAADNVKYLELRFTPVALARSESFSLAEVVDWVIDSSQQAERAYGVRTRLIASVNRNESVELAEQVAKIAADRIDQGVVGLDLAGDEDNFPGYPFAKVFREAKQAGLQITVHAGEWGGPENVVEAIEVLGAERIGHGIRILEDLNAVELAKDRKTVFEICPTSNFQSGVFKSLEAHKLPELLQRGLIGTINTDDPGISRITLSDEYKVACESLSLSLKQLANCVTNAANAAFLPTEEKQKLVKEIKSFYTAYE